ncbi:DUF421 domain-containing protein [Deinococcus roseus]|uniref:DUF421 domain-containing protein n=1 Tax=Deinococcus roseus TaxID=392414 RepID=A0ABQ2D8P5_9DEIO|nr:YetF domain-containing protein [Deinococcus roseus]GGJ49910.1 DUF421 domain-containing protein [Deinococcus roseus]
MEPILHGAILYFSLMLIFRVAGKRSLAQTTTFDFVLLLIISETVDNYFMKQDYSYVGVLSLVVTLIGLDILLSKVKQKSPLLERWMDDVPVILIDQGKVLDAHLKKSRIDLSDILEAARTSQGIERLDQIKYAILERSGTISVVPKEQA